MTPQARQRELHSLCSEIPRAILNGLTEGPIQRLQSVAQNTNPGEEVELIRGLTSMWELHVA